MSADNDCMEWAGSRTASGYGQVSKAVSGTRLAHRVAWILTHGEVPEGLNVCHTCDNRLCVNPEHLFIGTQRDNLADMTRKNRRAVGHRVASPGALNPASKLNEDQVLAIRTARGEGVPRWVLAEKYNVSVVLISKITSGKVWSHLPLGPKPPEWRDLPVSDIRKRRPQEV